jgi:hypothetical protein
MASNITGLKHPVFVLDRICGHRSRDPGSILWEVVGMEWDPLSPWVQLRSYLEDKVAAPV